MYMGSLVGSFPICRLERGTTKMCWRLLFFSSFIILLPVAPTAQYFCYPTGNYSSNSTYRSNLVGLLASMYSNTEIDYGFYNFSAGENTDKVNAIALCRGDITPESCRNCINSTSQALLQSCPYQTKAFMGDGMCTLRYSNRTIFGTLETEHPIIFYNTENASNVENFNQVLGQLLDRLTKRAAQGNSTRKFALDSEPATDFETLYALVECTPDLDPEQCTNCLKGLVKEIPRCCYGKQGGRYVAPSCDLRFETYLFYDLNVEESSPPPIVPPASPPPPQSLPPVEGNGRNSTRIVILIVLPIVASLVLIICICIFYTRLVKKSREQLQNEPVYEISSAEERLQFEYRIIEVATENFSAQNKLGEGGFGAVYKGTFPNGKEIAVKRLSMGSQQGDAEFKNEVRLVAMLQHRNLTRLLGFCLKGRERLLVYELVRNSSLDKFIFDPIKRAQLNWEVRDNIIQGIARGLLYLHQDSRLRIIHRDLKASNILLDADMNPKISDFGTARLFEADQTQANTHKIVGTYGYMPPEYVIRGHFSVKSDVFSFGVLVLEIVSGKKINSIICNGDNEVSLLSYAWRNWREGTISNLADPTIRNSFSETQIMRCIHIGLLCVQENLADRPNMASVVLMFNSQSITLPVPTRPAFLMHSNNNRSDKVHRSSSVQPSINEASISELDPR